MRRPLLWLALASCGLVGCTDLAILPDGARIVCADDEACPADFVCRDSIGRCVPAADVNRPPIAFEAGPTLDRDRVSYVDGHHVARLTASLSEAPFEPARVTVAGEPLACGEGVELSCDVDARGLELPEGVHAVALRVLDRAGNELTAELALEVDRTAPRLVAAPVVRLTPLGDNLVDAPTALGVRGAASVDLVVDGLLGELPVARLAGDPALDLELTGAPELATDIAFSFELVLDGAVAHAQGERAVTVELTDSVGNEATLTTGATIVVDTEAPVAPDVDTPEAVVFERRPWGTADAPLPSFRVVAASGAVEGDALVQAFSEADRGGLFLGEGSADGDGAFTLPTFPIDVPRVELVAVDGAGNESPRATTRDVRWTASLGLKVRGSRVENPHALFAPRLFEPYALRPNLEDEATDVTAFGADLAAAQAGPQAGEPELLEAESVLRFARDPDFLPASAPAYASAGVAYHAGRGTLMSLGGFTGPFTPSTDDFLELVDGRFVEVEVNDRPPLSAPPMVYDWRGGRLIAVVGSQTWAFENDNWRTLPASGGAPPGAVALAYDRARGRTVATDSERTFVLEGDAWRELTGAHPPLKRPGFAIAYDPARGGVILHGGVPFNGSFEQTGELYVLGETDWTKVADTLLREDHTLVENPATGTVYAVGGTCDAALSPCEQPDDTGAVFRLEGDSFTYLASFPFAGPLQGGNVVAVPGLGVVWFGGTEIASGDPAFPVPFFALAEDDVTVRDLAAVLPTPNPRTGGRGVYDPAADELLIAFGVQVSGDALALLEEVGALGPLGGRSLGDVPGGRPEPFSPFFDGAAFRYARGPTELVRRSGDTWVQDSAPASFPGPSAAFAFHEGLGLAVGFGGSPANDTTVTYSSAGVLGSLSPATTPPARGGGRAIYDERRGDVILYGGRDGDGQALADTWAFDGADWRQLDDAGPLSSDNGWLAYDAVRHRTILHDGEQVYELSDDAGWLLRELDLPEPRTGMAFGFDGRRMVAFGGSEGFGSSSVVLATDGEPASRPALVFEVDLRARLAHPESELAAIEVQARTGGRGFAFADGTLDVETLPGVQLSGWGDLWVPLAADPADVDAPADVAVTVVDPARLTELVRGSALHLALTPMAGQGPGGPGVEMARLAARRFEVTVVYRE